MEKIAFVVRQYGLEVNGGGETHCRAVAERLLPYYDAEVLTSTSMKYPFEHYYAPGVERINGVTVRRFTLAKTQNKEKMAQLNNRMLNGEKEAEKEWIEESGPFCPDFIPYLKAHAMEYKAILFFAYGHCLTYAGLQLDLPHTILVPLAHDEGNIYRPLYRDVFRHARAFLFNTYEERDLVYRLFGMCQMPHRVTCIGVDASVGQKEAMPEKFADIGPYIIYVGRVTYTKNFAELNQYFIEYKKRRKTALKLVVLGRVREDFPIRYHEDIIFMGFVSEKEKRALICHAEFMVLPSKTESLSFVILESFLQKKPVLVNGYSPVLVGQCKRSNAGLYYTNYAEFEAGMDYLLNHPEEYKIMGENGLQFVKEHYRWDVVLNNIRRLIEEVRMVHNESYAFWDLVAEEAYEPQNPILRKGNWEIFCKQAYSRKIYMFGCNDACREFIRQYRNQFRIAGVLDNSRAKWGMEFEGFPVLAPGQIIRSLSPEEAAVIIAMRLNADSVARQLDSMGFHNYYGLGVLVAGMAPYCELVQRMKEWKETCPVEDIILLESTNDFDGNSGALYEYLKAAGSRHRFVWIVKEEESKKLLLDEKDLALCPRCNIEDLKKYIYYRAVSRWQIWDNHPIRKVRKEQTNVFLQHFGMGYKQIARIFNSPAYVDYALNTNRNVYEYEKKALLYAADTKIIFGELPRNDVLFSRGWRELEKITSRTYSRVIMWAPTLRDSKLYNRVDSDLEYPFGISVIYTKEKMDSLNQFLRKRDMLLLIKIHPRQKCNYTDEGYSNIVYLNGETVKKVHAYKLLTQMDAMISDYSSIVFDYMLLDRPIAWALEDMQHYQVEFLMENPLDFMPGEKIYCYQDLLDFLEHVRSGRDLFRKERRDVAARYNAPAEGKGCENIVKILGL